MSNAEKKLERPIVLTGFMGVGKSTVARHLAYLLRANRIDLDRAIEETHGRTITDIVVEDGEAAFRDIEAAALKIAVESADAQIISLGGGTWTFDHNRRLIKDCNCRTIWLNAPFEHCWRNIQLSRGKRPLLQNKENARQLYDDRIKLYCLAEWHFVIQPDQNSIDVAKQILEEIF